MAEIEINSINELEEQLAKTLQEEGVNKPTEEEVAQAGEDFERVSGEFPLKLWEIGNPEQAREFVAYLAHFVRNRLFWTKNGWMGVVKLQEELKTAELLLNGKDPFKLGFQALNFTYYSLMNPGGVGLQSAEDFESEAEQYLPLMEAVSLTLDKANKELKEIQFLQDRWLAMQQGFYFEREQEGEIEPETEEVKESSEEDKNIPA